MKKIGVFFSVLIGVVYPPLILLLSSITSGRTNGKILLAPLKFFTTDTFLYLSVARNSVGKPFFTSDGLFPTNGFHPLWEFLLTKVFEISAITNDLAIQMLLVFGLSIILVAFGMGFFGLVIYGLTDNFALSLLAAVPGFYYLIFSLVTPHYNSTWSFINGMESPLSILWFGLLLYLTFEKKMLFRATYSGTLALAFLISLIIFTRLDDIFLLIPFLILIFLFSTSKRDAFGKLLVLFTVPSVAIFVYLIYNYSYAGSLLPVSGISKQGNWFIPNSIYLLVTFIPVILIHFYDYWSEAAMRSLQMCVPALLAVLWFLYWIKNIRRGNWETIIRENYDRTAMGALCMYVFMKGTYNLVFVDLWGQGPWYYPLSIMVFNLITASLVANSLKVYLSGHKLMILNVIALPLMILTSNAFINNRVLYNYNSLYYDFWMQRSFITQKLKTMDRNIKIIEFDDGVISYFLDIPTMNGLGFTLDREGFEAQSSGHLLGLAYSRGFRVIGVLNYLNLPPNIENYPDKLRDYLCRLPHIKLEDLNQWKFKILYKDPISNAAFISFEPVLAGSANDQK
jgi:hypothetical protein